MTKNDYKDFALVSSIPEGWGSQPIKRFLICHDGGAWGEEPKGDEGDRFCIRIADFDYEKGTVKNGVDLTVRNYRQNVIDRLSLKKGDIIVEKSGGGDKTPVGRSIVFRQDYNAVFANFSERLRVQNVYNYEFVNYCLRAFYSIGGSFNYFNQTTGIQNLNMGKYLSDIYLPCPQRSTQDVIVSYLDSKCSAIDEAIERHKNIIEKLEEYRKSVVSDIIIHGLNKNAPVRDSGIYGIGHIPSHYTPTRVKFLGTYRNGLTYSPSDVCDCETGTLVLRSSNIQDGKLTLNDNVYVKCSVDERIMVRDGDILICARNGSAKLVGKSALIEGVHATYGAFMMVLRTTAVPKYMYYMLNSTVMDVYRASFSTTTVNQLTAGILGNMVIPYCPDKAEQCAIVQYLDIKCAKIDSGIKSHQMLIYKLEEYKKSIIYNAVTGKIDCRTEAAG